MRHTHWNSRRKLMASLAVLGIVLVIAVVAQFTGKEPHTNPYAAAPAETKPVPGETQGRAVFGTADTRPDPTSASLPRPSQPLQTEPVTRARTTEPVAGGSEGVDRLLTRWRDTVLKGDVQGQTALYAPKVDRFFRQRNVSQASVRRVKAQMMTLYPTVSRYDISDVRMESNNGKEAVVSFRKDWEMKGQKPFSGSERQRLKLRRIDGDWRIVSEEETKVYWVKRG